MARTNRVLGRFLVTAFETIFASNLNINLEWRLNAAVSF
jgi:hypothetical protein